MPRSPAVKAAAAPTRPARGRTAATLALANLKRNQDLAQKSFISAGALKPCPRKAASARASLQSAQASLDAATKT
ncbi:MAG: hypothetical protein R3E42_11825 [Burkholderiaceae bacterium]